MFDSCYVHVFAWTVSDFVLHAVFVFESCLVTILFGDVVRLIWFWFCSCLVTNCIWFCSSYLNRVLFVLCHEYAMVAQLTWFHSCCVHVGTWTESYFVLHIWFIFHSCFVTNLLWRRSSPYLILIMFRLCSELNRVLFFIFDSYFVRALSRTLYGGVTRLIWILILFVLSHELYLNLFFVFDLHIWFVFCSCYVTNIV